MSKRKHVTQKMDNVTYLPASARSSELDTPAFASMMADLGMPGQTPTEAFKLNSQGQLHLPISWHRRAAKAIEEDLAWCRAQWS